MKQVFILVLSVSMLMVACRSQEMVPVEEPPVIVEEPVTEPEPEPEEIRVVEESFTFDRTEDEARHDANTYFVIVGSFIHRDNAERFMGTLRGQGFSPVILMSETGSTGYR